MTILIIGGLVVYALMSGKRVPTVFDIANSALATLRWILGLIVGFMGCGCLGIVAFFLFVAVMCRIALPF